MATSVQRLIIIIIMMNGLLIMINSFAYSTSDSEILTNFESEQEQNREWLTDIREGIVETNPDSQQYLADSVYGDVEFGQKGFGTILLNGIGNSYLGCSIKECETNYARWINNGISIFLWIFNVILGLEALYLWYSKKYT